MALNEYDDAVEQLPAAPVGVAAKPANPYDGVIQQQDAGQQQQLRTSLVQADETTPDRAAEVQKLSTSTGIPAEIVERNYDTIRQRAKFVATPYQDIVSQTPALATWAAQPANAAVASDDMEKLGALEWLVAAPQRAISQALNEQQYGALRTKSLFGPLSADEQDQLDAAKYHAGLGGRLGAGDSWFKNGIVGAMKLFTFVGSASPIGGVLTGEQKIGAALTAAGGLVGGIAGSVLPGPGTVAGAASGAALGHEAGMAFGLGKIAFETAAGPAYDEFLGTKDELGRPLDPDIARAAALAVGVINGSLMGLTGETALKAFGLDKLGAKGTQAAVAAALQQPTIRAALLDAVKGYGAHLIEGTALSLGQAAVTILGGELAKGSGYRAPIAGQIAPGNVDLYKQPKVANPDGSISTVDSVSANFDGKEVLLPRVTPDGRHLDTDAAIAEYKKTGRNLGTFETPEAATAFAEQLHNDYAAGKYDAHTIASQLLSAATSAAQTFAVAGLVGLPRAVAADIVRAKRAAVAPTFFQALGEGVAQSKTAQRLPDALQSLLTQATQDGPVSTLYAPVDTWATYWQSKGVDPAQMATEITGDAQAFDQAKRTGEDLAIPTARYATKLAATEHNAFFANELRLAPAEMNGREAQQFEQNLEAQVDAAKATPVETPAAPAARVRETVQEQLEAAGIERSTAESYATLYEQAFQTLGERAGVDPEELFKRAQLTIDRPELAPETVEGETQFDQQPRPEFVAVGDEDVANAEYAAEQSTPYDGPDRRADDGVSPTGTERRNPDAPIFGTVAERVAQMRAENPNIDADAKGMRQRAEAAGRIPEPVELRQNERGVLRIGPNREMRISLLKTADLSTFLHESGHLFLETMRDLAAEPGAASIRNDLATLDEHLFAGAADATEKHERFARGFEAYLMEGKAPSAELRSVFARFRTWLIGIYRSVRGLGVELSPEVRGVFDRLVASDAAIEQAQAEGHVEPLFTDATMAGMTPEAFEAYRGVVQAGSERAKDELQAKLLRDLTREQTAHWKSERETLRAQVAIEAGQEPIFRALSAIQKGTRPDGSPLVEGQEPTPLKLAKAELAERYTAEEMKALRRRQLYAAEGGESPEVVAQLVGYSSGDELVRALLTAPSMKDAINRETDARMKAKHGDLLVDGRLADQAQQAVYGEGRQRVIEAELKALTSGMVKGTIPPAGVINAAAERRIAGTRIRDVRPGQFLMAARRASQRAFDLLATHQDRAGAVQAKQQELINLALYREANKAQDAVESAVTYLRSFDGTAKRERMGKAGADYLEQIDGLRARFDLGRLTLKEIDRRQSLATWAAAKEKSTGLPLELPEELLNEARRGHYKDLTVDELQGVRDGVRMIEHLATLKNKLLKSKAGRELSAAASDVVLSIGEHSTGARETSLEMRLPGSAASKNIATFFASHRKLSSLLREMDGFKDGGVLWESVMRPINDAADAEAVRNEQATVALHKIVGDAYKGEETTLYHKTFIPAIGDSLTKMGRLMVALNWGNEGNRQRIMDGYHWRDEQVRAILDGLDERDWKFVQGVWDHINTYWDDIAAKEKRVTGVAPEKVEASPVQTRFGEMRGGYFPIKYEHELSARASANLEAGFAEGVKQASYVRATTQRGHTEARAAEVKEPVRLDFGVITEHVQQVIHDLTHHEALIDVGRILGHRDVQDAIYKHYGAVAYDQIKGAVRDIAFGNTAAPGWYKTLNAIRAKTVTATLGWNAITSLMHSLQITRGMVRVGPGYVAHGLVRWLSSAKNAENSVAWIESQSDMMRLRWKTQQRELNEVRNSVGLDRGKVSAAIHDALAKAGVDPGHMPEIADSYFYAIRRIVQFAEIPTWIGAYEKAMADTANDPARAVALANQAVEDSMGSGQIKDLAAVQRAPMARLLTTFYDYHNAVYQQAYELVKNSDSPGRKVVDASLLLFVPVALGAALHHVASQGAKPAKGTVAGELTQDSADYALNMFVGLRELSGAFTGRDYEGPAGLKFVPAVRSFLYRAGVTASQAASGHTDDLKTAQLARSTNELGGTLFGYPARQIERTAGGIQALWEGKTKDLSAVVFGGPKEGSR